MGNIDAGGYENTDLEESVESVQEPVQEAQRSGYDFFKKIVVGVGAFSLLAKIAIGIDAYAKTSAQISEFDDLAERIGNIITDPRLNNQDPESRYHGEVHALRAAAYEAENVIEDTKEAIKLYSKGYTESINSNLQALLMAQGLNLGFNYDSDNNGVSDLNPEQLEMAMLQIIEELKNVQETGNNELENELRSLLISITQTLVVTALGYKAADYLARDSKNNELKYSQRVKTNLEESRERLNKRKNSEKRKNDDRTINVAGNGTNLTDEELLQLIQEQNQKEA